MGKRFLMGEVPLSTKVAGQGNSLVQIDLGDHTQQVDCGVLVAV